MKLSDDITSPRLLKIKGLLFALLGLVAATLLLLSSPTFQNSLLIIITIWAFCRFYYFLFYVLVHYAGRKKTYAGVIDALKEIIRSPK